jgi:hypothetical protein
MTKPLTLLNREDKGDVDPGSPGFFAGKLNASFPSYFTSFSNFSAFLPVRANAALKKLRIGSKHKIPLAAAFMAIV